MSTTDGSSALTFGTVDRAVLAAALGARLRTAGVNVSQHGLAAFARALEAHPPDSLSALYWSARLTLVSRHRELDTFDRVFGAVFEQATMGVDPHARRSAGHEAGQDDVLSRVSGSPSGETEGAGLPWHTLPSAGARADDANAQVLLHQRLPSDARRVADTPFGELDEDDLSALGDWLEQVLHAWPVRRTRRRRRDAHGSVVDLRRTIAQARRSGGDPVHIVRTRRAVVPRQVVMLCDVSQSMEPYATAYLHLMRALARSGRAETFAFSTTLTRVTPALQHHSAREAIEQAGVLVVDRFGGTRIATNVRALLASRHGQAIRGSVMIVASDGWDTDSAEDLAREMARLQRRAHRVVWLNPRAGFPGFEPRVASMQAALRYCDEFLPAHTVTALIDALGVIERAGPVSSRA